MSEHLEFEKAFSQGDFDRFAELSGDCNPIHVDADFSAQTRFGRTVCHGLLLITVVRGLIDRLLPGARQLRQEVMVPAPTYANEAMRFVLAADPPADGEQAVHFRVERCADETVTCQGTAVLATGPAV